MMKVQIQNRLAKSALHRLQRTAALPFLCGRGLPEKALPFIQVSPAPPLALSQTVETVE